MSRFLCTLAAWMFPLLTSPAVNPTNDGSVCVPPGAAPVYQFHSPVWNRDFYTLDTAERDRLLAQWPDVWAYERIAFRAFASPDADGLAPVHRFWSVALNSHFYTIDEHEVDTIFADYPDIWAYEGIGFFAYPTGLQPAGTIPIHRFWSNPLESHRYTASDRERFKLAYEDPTVWQYEGMAWHAYPASSSTDVEIVKGPALEWITTRSATILWETHVAAETHVGYTANSADEFEFFDPAWVTLHKVVLSDLLPDTPYAYAASSGTAHMSGSFRTAPSAGQRFRFAVCSDTQWDPNTHSQVATGILEHRPGIVLHAGDLTSMGRSLDIWETEFFGPAAQLLATTPVIPVPGNHEYFGQGPPWFFYFFDRPVDEGWFALDYGDARMIGLHTGAPFCPGSPQHEWLLRELTSPACRDAAWRVVIFHEPPFTSTSGHRDNLAVQEHLVPLFEQYAVDVVFSGHSHAYERYTHNGIYYLVTGGGGGYLYTLLPDKTPPFREFGRSVHHYCIVDVDSAGGTFTIQAIDTAGEVFDLVELRK